MQAQRLNGAGRGLLRSARALAATALLALFGGLALPATAQAQTDTTLVSNTDQTGSSAVGSIAAQPFTAGSDAVLTSVDVYLGSNGSTGVGDIRVRILQDDSGSPGITLVTLDYLTTKINNAVNTFTAPTGTNLAAGMTYYVELSKNGERGINYWRTRSHAQNGATDWKIGNTRYFKNNASVPSWSTSDNVMIIAINGTAVGNPTLSVGDASGNEGGDVTFMVTLSEAATDAVTATWTASIEGDDTAVAADLESTTGTVTIAPNATTKMFPVRTAGDTTDEHDETFTLTLSGVSSNAELASDPTATGTITDDDDPPTVSVGDATAVEGATLAFPVTLSAVSGKTVTVNWATSVETGDSATADTDFTAVSATTLTFMPDEMEKTVAVQTTGDALDEPDETFTVTLSSPTNAVISGATATGTITNADVPPPTVVTDGVSVTSTPVAATDTYGVDETIEISVTFDEAVNATTATDFVLSVNGAKRAPLLRGSGTATLVFGYVVQAEDTDDNGIWIGDQDRTLVGDRNSNPQNGAITSVATSLPADITHGQLGRLDGHKVDGSLAPPIVVTDGVSVTSTPGAATDTYGATETIEISVTFDEAVNATTATDFVLSVNGDKRAPLLRGSGTATLVFGYVVQAEDTDADGIWIGDQDRTLVGDRNSNPQNGAITSVATSLPADITHGQLGELAGHKVDGSLAPPVVTIAADHEAFTARLDRVTFTLTRVGRTAAALDVAVALTQDGDLLGSEYLAHTVTFEAGAATAKLRIGGPLFAGTTVTGEATLTATVQAGSGYVPGSPASASTQIRVADPAVTVWIEETAYTFDEGVGADAIVAVILRTATGVPVPHELISVSFSLKTRSGQTAEVSLDYAPLAVLILAQPTDFTADGAVFIARKEVTLTIVDDALDEPDETLAVVLERSPGMPEAVKLTEPDGTVCPSGCAVPVTITDNDEPSEVTIAADQPAFTAEIDDVTFTLTRTEDPAAALTVGVALTQDQDLLLSEDLAQNVTFGAGEATATLQLLPDFFVGHTVTEETTLTATVQAGSGYVPGSPNTASTRIVVTDPAVTASIEATSYTFAEGADATVAVILRTATGVPSPNRDIALGLSFDYTSGLAGSNDLGSGSVSFDVAPSDFTPDGAEFTARKEVTLPIVDDALDEPDETLALVLDRPPQTSLSVVITELDGTVCPSGCSVTVTITDNDAPDVTMQTVGGATWTLTGERTPAPGDTYTYSITLASGAKPTNEYVGFYLPDSATNQDLLGNDHTDCAAPKQFCATFTGATGNTSVWDGTGGHDTISYLLGATSPHTATATLAIDQDTPLGTAITFGAIDKDGTPRSGGLTITVTEPGGAVPNTAPVITTTSPVETPENGTAVVTLAATDADGDPITWTKTGGADTARFALTSAGVLTFVAAPDYEDPADVASADPANAAANNEYVVFVTASDGTADTADTELKLVVQVTNVDEGQSGTVSIDDTAPMVGDELTASTADVADPDGLPDPFAPTWKWYRTPSGGSEAVISGATSATYTVVEADRGAALTAKASWTDAGGFANTLASAPTAAVTALPTVTVAAATGGETVTEGTDAAFTLSRTGATTAALTVTVTVSETGSVLKDASAVPSSVTFAAGAATATLALATNDDDTDDDNGTVTVTLGTDTGYTVGDPGAATVAVSDNDVPVDFVLAVPATVAEDAGTATVTVTATTAENAPPATLVEVQLARVGGTATGGSDYDAVSETVRFQVSDFAPATVDGQPRYQAEWTHDVVIHDDEEVEGDETLVLEMSPTSAFLLIHTLQGGIDAVRATLTIVDNDDDPPTQPQPSCAPNPDDIWCGVVTVMEHSFVGESYDGFLESEAGDLSEKNFTYGVNRYTIDAILVGKPTEDGEGRFMFSLTSKLTESDKAALVLYVGSTAIPLDVSDYFSAGGGHWYFWEGDATQEGGLITPGPGLDWTSETTVTVRLREASTTCTLQDAIWCGVVTPGDLAGEYGFLNDIGLLSDTDFEYDSTPYTIDEVSVSEDSGQLRFSLTADLTAAHRAALELHVDGSSDSFAFSEATDPAGSHTYQWPGTGLDWSSVPPVTLRLRDRDTAPTFPGKPTNLTATANGSTQIDLGWDAPDPGTDPITGYRIEVWADADTGWTDLVANTGNADTTYAHTGLSAGDTRHYRVSAINTNGTSVPSDERSATTLTNAPVFADATATRTVAENSAADTNVGDAFPEATDADGDPLTYSMEGMDTASFTFDASARQIKTQTGVTYNYEAAKNTYSVTVKADDGTGGTDTIAVTITLTNVDEKSAKPAKPTVTAKPGTTDSLNVSWVKPGLNGGPDITGYKVRYRQGSGDWQNFTHVGAATTATITGLSANTEYQVQVRALNDETPSDWSDPSDAVRTNAVALPVVSVGDASATEGSPVTFTVTLSEAARDNVTVNWETTGDTATSGNDFTAASGTLTIAAGAQTGTVEVATLDDDATEGNETFTLTLSNPSSNAELATDPTTASGTIVDNDVLPTLSVANAAAAAESDGVTFTVTLSEAATADVTATWTASIETGDTAEAADFESTTGTVTFTPSQKTVTITVPTVDDTTDEDDDTFTLTLSSPSANATLASDATATGTITDNDDPPTISVEDQTVIEGDQDPEDLLPDTDDGFPFRVTLSAASEKQVRYKIRRVELASDTATAADLDDDDPLYPGTSAISPGDTVSIRGGNVILNDDLDEPDETFTLEIYDLENAAAGAQTHSTITIEDDDDPPSVSVDDAAATEGSPVTFTVTLSAASGWEVTVNWATTGDTATSDTDFTAASDTLTVMPGETTATVAVATEDDTLDEPDEETFTLTLSSPSNATLGEATATGTITDNDDPPTLGVADAAATEGDPVEFTVTLSAAATADVTATWTASTIEGDEGKAAAADLGSPTTGLVTVPKGETTATFTVATAEDTLDENDETFTVALSSPSSNATLATDATTATGTIVDNDVAPNAAPSFTSSDTFTPAENQTAAGTVRAEDSDGDAVTGYALSGGADQALFAIDKANGALTFLTAPNYEDPQDANTDNAYVVVVQATSGTGDREQTGTQTITVTVMDDDTEAPDVPGAPSVSAASVTSLNVSWTAPANAGPEITDYDVQYRAGTSAPWSDGSHIGTALTAMLTGLLEDTEYDVQVRATNDEGTGGWSASGSGATDANAAPSFTSAATFNPAENQTAVGTVRASDSDTGDEVTGYEISGGADRALFAIDETRGVLTFQAAPNYEDPKDAGTDNAYLVVVQATSGTGDREQTGTQTITVTVMDDDTEAPAAPDAPSVSPASATSLTVTWSAPANAGPEITDYDVQYRAGTSAPWSDGSHIGTALTAMLTGLLEDTEYDVQVRATNDEGTGGWSASGSGATDANAAPSFTSAATFNPAENQTAVGTVAASDSDTGDEVTGYALSGGADRALFSINNSGVLTFQAAPDYEDPQDQDADNAYLVTVQATSGTGDREQTATQPITVTVMDDDTEAPDVPGAPSVSAASVTSLNVSWTAPANAGPEITDYDVQYRAGTSAPWSDGSHIGTALTAMLTGLLEDTEYDVQVRATNDEGTGGWSASGSGATDANAAPSFTSAATFNPAENQTAVGTVRASDSDTGDEVTGYEISGGADRALFAIDETRGVLTFQAAPNYEDPKDAGTDNAYLVVVQATSGTGDREQTGTQTITVTVMDDDTEAPAAPDAPSVSPASVTSLNVSWSAPANAGPEITDYDVQYRAGTSAPWSDGSHIGTALTAMLTGLLEDTEYDVQVRATNDEGTGGWSASGSGATDANAAPSFTSAATFNPAENQTAVGTVRASDSDTGDEVTGYALSGGADRALFSINNSGVLTFQAAPDYEDPQDQDADNAYLVTVQATSGTGDREQTATQPITVTVMDADEQPATPAKPTLAAVSGSSTSLTATWTEPGRNGGPDITGYNVEYRVSTATTWDDFTHTDTATTTTITGLTAGTSYQVRVQALNGETPSAWSDPSDAVSTNSAANNAPSFTSSTTFSPAENQTAVGTVEASDSDTGDAITGYALSGGADQALFAIDETHGVLTFQAAPDYEDPQDANTDNAYVVEVQATGGTGDRELTGTQTITVTVIDADEQPATPAKPTLAAVSGSSTSLTATWTEPGLNGGPDITGYDVGYRVGTSGDWEDFTHRGTGVTTTITGLTADTAYQVQVRALNDETPSDWSDPSDAVSTDTQTMAEEPEDRLQEINCAMARLDDESDARCDGIDGMLGSYVNLVALQFQVIGQLPPGEYDYYDLAGWQTLYKMGDGRVIITKDGDAWTEDLTPARAPRDLEAKATGEGIVLSWQAPKAASDEVTGYRVLRWRPEEGEPVLRAVVADIGGTATAWTDTGFEEGVLYTYWVMAVRGRELSGVSNARSLRGVAMADSGPPPPPPLTASFEGVPKAHDGERAFRFRVAFSEDIGTGYRSMRDAAFTVSGGAVTRARRVDGRHDLWEITVVPDSDKGVAIALPGGRECGVSGAICTRGENRRRLANTPTATVKPGLLGDVTVRLEGGRGLSATILGPATARRLSGSADDDTLSGRADDDVLYGDDDDSGAASGDDLLDGGSGDDTLYGGDDDDTLYGGDGHDELYGGGGHDALYGDNDDSGAASGDDLLDGGSGDDILYGDGGDDVLLGGDDDDALHGGGGHDELYGDDDDSGAASGDDLLDGGSGDDILYGDGGDDVLEGGADDDTLDGGAGLDALYGDGGVDSLTGGTGADTFVFAAGDGTDTITDFFPEEGDRIDLSAFAGLEGFASLKLTADGSTTILDLRAHGGGTVRLEGIAVADLLAADFLWP